MWIARCSPSIRTVTPCAISAGLVFLGRGGGESTGIVYAGVTSRTRTQDVIHPEVSSMRNLWATVSLDGALAMSWYPGLPSAAQRTMTVDPPAPEPAD